MMSLVLLFCFLQTRPEPQPDRIIAFPEQEDIRLDVLESKDYMGRVMFFAPHENEHVVNQYLADKIHAGQGRFLILRQNGERHITFHLDNQSFEVDPNRIFTPAGAHASLLGLNEHLSEGGGALHGVHQRALSLGRFILEQMAPRKKRGRKRPIIVAIHNNTDGYDKDGKGGVGTVSMERYALRLAQGARFIKKLYRGAGDEDDLFFINRGKDFRAMKRAGWNVVCQHPRVAVLPEEDDGSLSVYAEMEKLRYINIEAQRKEGDDHLEEQTRMVELVYRRLFQRFPENKK